MFEYFYRENRRNLFVVAFCFSQSSMVFASSTATISFSRAALRRWAAYSALGVCTPKVEYVLRIWSMEYGVGVWRNVLFTRSECRPQLCDGWSSTSKTPFLHREGLPYRSPILSAPLKSCSRWRTCVFETGDLQGAKRAHKRTFWGRHLSQTATGRIVLEENVFPRSFPIP